MDKNLLEILACPICKGELLFDQPNQELICKFDRIVYPVIDDIPVLLASRSRRLESDE
ncbi:MAG: Trm112 family protein [Gammaproteobacteria bacterium]